MGNTNVHMDFTPETVAYENIENDEDLLQYSQEYAQFVVDEYDMDVDLELVSQWEVSHRAKRRAAAVKHLSIDQSVVGIPIDWDNAEENNKHKLAHFDRLSDVRECFIRLSWGPIEVFDENEWKKTIRHELIHVEEYQKYGDSGHSYHFKSRANEIDAPIKCPRFTEPKYVITCMECDKVVADRHRKSKVVKSAIASDGRYTSQCCGARLTLR